MAQNDVFSIILAGGSGTRFWPASRRARPKQLLGLGASSEESLIASTVRRLLPLCAAEHVLIATGAHLLDATRRALPDLPESSFLGEPIAKNTAPCIGWATAIACRRDPDAVVMVLPSDHHIGDEPAFRAALTRALDSARAGVITTIGITPSRPETGYGYIEAGDVVSEGVRRVQRFVEKPDVDRAKEYVASGRYFWNSGMFFFRGRDMLEALRAHEPAIARGIEAIDVAAREGTAAEVAATRAAFDAFPSISIDYAVMERAERLHVVPASFGWSDLGSWHSAWELAEKDPAGNAAPEGAVLVDAKDNLAVTLHGKKVVALVGVEGLCVVDTEDALLVMPRERAQDVRLVVDALKARGDRSL
ncbi:MAG: mannose-1-phosphate guanylyltransferase [Myxococcales bacterium]|nr:mannose-1-phosphate guanylyltransferase [Myxococcales bacterium]MCB9578865.1 mannose-1-phosphate guanylyltransferase [Polyangiaceae bacterium]